MVDWLGKYISNAGGELPRYLARHWREGEYNRFTTQWALDVLEREGISFRVDEVDVASPDGPTVFDLYQRVETAELAKVSAENIHQIAEEAGWMVDYAKGEPQLVLGINPLDIVPLGSWVERTWVSHTEQLGGNWHYHPVGASGRSLTGFSRAMRDQEEVEALARSLSRHYDRLMDRRGATPPASGRLVGIARQIRDFAKLTAQGRAR